MLSRAVRSALVFASIAATAAVLGSCNDEGSTAPDEMPVTLSNTSPTPALVKNVMSGVTVYSLLSSDDVLSGSPDFVFGGSADGNGLMRNADGTFTLLVNNEDNFAVSRIKLDQNFKPLSGDYLLNSDGGRFRLCSATLATVAEHGFGPIFLTAGESSNESMIHAVDPFGSANTSRLLSALGRWTAEQALPLPKTAYAGKTVILIGDDDSGANGGQVAMYVANTVGDLDNGNLYVLARTTGGIRERDMVVGQTYPVEFKQIANQKTLTGAQIDAASAALSAMRFGRVEDIDYRRGTNAGRELYFNVTGQNNNGVNADYSRTKYGRTYRLVLDAADPLKGTLEVILDGDDRSGPVGTYENPDNLTVTDRYVYIVEDPNGYGDETHDSRMYQYDIASKTVKVVMELDHRRGEAKYNVGGNSALGSWEFAGMIDISDLVRRENTFLLSIQPHTWTGDRYRAADRGTVRAAENQASQLVVLSGLPR